MKKVTKDSVVHPSLYDYTHDPDNPAYRHLKPQIHELAEIINQTFKKVEEAIKPFNEWLELVEKENINLIFSVADGDMKALKTLTDKWKYGKSKLWVRFCETRKADGMKATQEEFEKLVYTICFEYIKENESKPVEKIWSLPQSIHMNIKRDVNKEYQKLKAHISYNENIGTNNRGKLIPRITFIKNKEGQDCILTKTAAEIAQVRPRTITNWIKKGYINATKEVYSSTDNLTYYIPYSDDLIKQIRTIKEAEHRKKTCSSENLLTPGQLAKQTMELGIPLNRKLLLRWVKNGKLVSQKIGNINYFSHDQITRLPNLIKQSKSSKLKQSLQ